MYLLEAYVESGGTPKLGSIVRCGRVHREAESFVYVGTAMFGGGWRPVVVQKSEVSQDMDDQAPLIVIEPGCDVVWQSDKEPPKSYVRKVQRIVSQRNGDASPETDYMWPSGREFRSPIEVAGTAKTDAPKPGDTIDFPGELDTFLYCGKYKDRWIVASKGDYSGQDFQYMGRADSCSGQPWKVYVTDPRDVRLECSRQNPDAAHDIHQQYTQRPIRGGRVHAHGYDGLFIADKGDRRCIAICQGDLDTDATDPRDEPDSMVHDRDVEVGDDCYCVVWADKDAVKFRDFPNRDTIDLADRIVTNPPVSSITHTPKQITPTQFPHRD